MRIHPFTVAMMLYFCVFLSAANQDTSQTR